MESGLDLDNINAPQYFDFTEPTDETEGLDNYFGKFLLSIFILPLKYNLIVFLNF